MTSSVAPDSLVTLHYRISQPGGQPLVSTFEAGPATLQLGQGEMLPAIEALLVGLETGTARTFELPAEAAFGPYREELVEKVARRHLPGDAVQAMSVMEFSAPDGSRYSGLLRELTDEYGLVDFNHPLAGKAIRLDVLIVGVS